MKSAGEESQHLEVRGVGKKVRGEDALRPVARSRQPPDVPGEGGRVAGHVDQMGRSQRRDESQSGGMKAVPGRIGLVPPPGAPQGEWDLLMARLEWERKNPYRQER